MKRRLSYALLVVGMAILMVVALTPSNASAEKRTFQVRLADQSIITVTVDVPPGTPVNLIPLPGVVVAEIPNPTNTPAPTVPPVNVPNPTGGGDSTSPQTPPASGGEPHGNSGSSSDSGSGSPHSHHGSQQSDSGSHRGADTGNSDSQSQDQGSKADKKKKKKKHKKSKLRRPDGSPTPANPTFFDALPGPSTVNGVPNFVIQKFRVPLFLLPIYQAAGIEYGIRWEYLAAINEIETDYGRNLNVSSAGAVGWMQFIPSTWKRYGVDANDDKKKDPYNPVDAIFAAARYLKAAGGQKDMRRAIFAYNHADWYVDSVVLRARLIAGLPADLVGSLTGLTEGRFPIAARAQYADDLAEKAATKKVKKGHNAANVIEANDTRRGIDIFAKKDSPVVAVNDGVIKRIGRKKSDGSLFVQLTDAYGNQYTYENLGSVAEYYPVPKDETDPGVKPTKGDNEPSAPVADPKPTGPASAGRQTDPAAALIGGTADKVTQNTAPAAPATPRPQSVLKQRLFANPSRSGNADHGGTEQLFDSAQKKGGKHLETYRNYFARSLPLNSRNSKLAKLKKGSRVIAGTVLGRVGDATTDTDGGKASHIYFQIRPAGRGAPQIDPKPILDGWKLLESTAIYRASGKNALYGKDGDSFSIGQVLLLPKPLLEKRVLSDDRIKIYPGGRDDIKTGQIDRRVLATLEYLAESGLNPTVSCLKNGHSLMTASGNISEHSSGNAVDIAAINGIPIFGHQDRGGITEQTVRRLMMLQGTMEPHQIISLLDFGQNTLALSDHDDHIHVGFRPLFGNNSKLGKQAFAILKPGQWDDLIGRLKQIDNPTVPVEPSKYALPVKEKPASDAHRGE
jgi:hypothetical protein